MLTVDTRGFLLVAYVNDKINKGSLQDNVLIFSYCRVVIDRSIAFAERSNAGQGTQDGFQSRAT